MFPSQRFLSPQLEAAKDTFLARFADRRGSVRTASPSPATPNSRARARTETAEAPRPASGAPTPAKTAALRLKTECGSAAVGGRSRKNGGTERPTAVSGAANLRKLLGRFASPTIAAKKTSVQSEAAPKNLSRISPMPKRRCPTPILSRLGAANRKTLFKDRRAERTEATLSSISESDPKQSLLSEAPLKESATTLAVKKRDLGPKAVRELIAKLESDETDSAIGELRRSLSGLTVYTALIGLLLKIHKQMLARENCSNILRGFLERSKQAREIEELFSGVESEFAALALSHSKATLIFVLFVLNYVNIAQYETRMLKAFQFCLNGFAIVLGRLRRAANRDKAKARAIDELLSELSPNDLRADAALIESLRALRAVAAAFKQSIFALTQSIYQSAEVNRRVEALFAEFEQIGVLEAANNAFEVFEAAARATNREATARGSDECEPTDRSFHCENGEPNFILQPSKLESYLGAKAPNAPAFTLVLDLDETLVHFEENSAGGEFLVRPYVSEFLSQMSARYELIVFTAAVKDYADWIIDRIDPLRLIAARLYRNHTYYQNGAYIKDLSRLGRDLATAIIVDNNVDNFQLQPANGIYIKTWLNDPHDVALLQLSKVLTAVAVRAKGDLRVSLAEMQRKLSNARAKQSID